VVRRVLAAFGGEPQGGFALLSYDQPDLGEVLARLLGFGQPCPLSADPGAETGVSEEPRVPERERSGIIAKEAWELHLSQPCCLAWLRDPQAERVGVRVPGGMEQRRDAPAQPAPRASSCQPCLVLLVVLLLVSLRK
jgi:hypothetical protein